MLEPSDTLPLLLASQRYYEAPRHSRMEKDARAALKSAEGQMANRLRSENDRQDLLNILGYQHHRALLKDGPLMRAAVRSHLEEPTNLPKARAAFEQMIQLGSNFRNEESRTRIIYEIAHADLNYFGSAVSSCVLLLGHALKVSPKLLRTMKRGRPETFPPMGGYRATPDWVVKEVYGG